MSLQQTRQPTHTHTQTDTRTRNIFASKQMDKLCWKPVVSWQLLAHVVGPNCFSLYLYSVFRIQFSVFRSQFTVNSFPFRVFRCCSSSFSVFCFQFKVLANILRLLSPSPLIRRLRSFVWSGNRNLCICICMCVCICMYCASCRHVSPSLWLSWSIVATV